MANNRMWLVHVPSGLAVLLGKRMAVGWWSPPESGGITLQKRMDKLFDVVGMAPEHQDVFALAMEEGEAKVLPSAGWRYSGDEPRGDGLLQLEIATERGTP